MRKGFWAFVVAFYAAASLGCLSPTLPLPPPGTPDSYEVSADRQSLWIHGFGARPGALVLAFNETTHRGAIAEAGAAGEYELTVPADLARFSQNRVVVWQRVGNEDSEGVVFVAPPRCALDRDGGGLEGRQSAVCATSAPGRDAGGP